MHQLPSVGSQTPQDQDVAADAAFLRDRVLQPLLEADKDVVLIMHSYGGMPSAAAASGISKQERQASGKPGGVVGLIFVAASLAKEGQAQADVLGGQLAPWVVEKVGDATDCLHKGSHCAGTQSWLKP